MNTIEIKFLNSSIRENKLKSNSSHLEQLLSGNGIGTSLIDYIIQISFINLLEDHQIFALVKSSQLLRPKNLKISQFAFK